MQSSSVTGRKVDIFFGPPGTGKTTKLLDIVENALSDGVPPERIAYLAFTRKAAYEARDRAIEKFGYAKDEFPLFRTLHSVAFQELGLMRSQVMAHEHYLELSRAMGIQLRGVYDHMMERPPEADGAADHCLSIYALAKAKGTSLEEEWRLANENDLPYFLVRDFAAALDHFKQEKGLLDFTDFLTEWQGTLDVDLFILDEAQDLTPQQWAAARRAGGRAPHVVIAGDDDQAIYRWAGADIRPLLAIKGERHVLPISYRLPKAIYRLAEKIVSMIRARFPKTWKPREEEGEVNTLVDPEQADFRRGTWYALARHRLQLQRLADIARSQGVVYQHNGIWSNQDPAVRAVLHYEQLRKGGEITFEQAAQVVNYVVDMAPIDRRLKGTKISYRDISWPWRDAEAPDWMSALTRLSGEDREYIRLCKRNGESLVDPGRVVISTIHGVKGGQADNVLLLPDVNKRVYESMLTSIADEARVFYVAVSRARHSLHLVSPRSIRHFSFA